VPQEREIHRVGAEKSIAFDARVIVATHRNLQDEVSEGNFREDLFYRLLGLPIALPPLRDRGNDIILLANFFLKNFIKNNGLSNLKISKEAKNKLLNYSFNYEDLFSKLNELNISFFGGIFPGIINERRDYKSGIILKVLPHVAKPVIIQGWENPDFEIEPFLKDIPTDDGAVSFFTLVDGLTSEVTTYLQKLYHYYGNAIPFMGAGAGSISLIQQPCVFTNDGMFQDAAVLFPMKFILSEKFEK